MTAETVGAQVHGRGRTTIRAQAIRRVIEGLAAEAAGVSAARVSASLSDERGGLAVRVMTPVDLGPNPGSAGNLTDRAGAIVDTVTAGLDDLVGRAVGRIEVRITGLRAPIKRRVQ